MSKAHRIGVLGGTFDPIHVGHLVVAVNARALLALDEVLLVVANEPWQKLGDRPISKATDRLALVSAAANGLEGIEASAIEIERGGPSYTADTVRALAEQDPGAELFVIVGADVARNVSTWRRLDEVEKLATLVVVNRPGGPELSPDEVDYGGPYGVVYIEVPALEISGTDLRHRVAAGLPLDFLIPEEAVRLMSSIGLYAHEE